MAETALCRYHCGRCDAELEQEGYMIVEATDAEPVQAILSGEANLVSCPQCDNQVRLNIPLLYHDAQQELFMIFVSDLAQSSQEDLAETIRYPFGMVVIAEAERRGIELPEPDDAAFPREQEEEMRNQPGAKFHALTHEQATTLLPQYLLRPAIVDKFEVLQTAVQATYDGLSGEQILDDMNRLQLINSLISEADPIARRKLLHHNEPYLNDDIYEVIDTLAEQMTTENQLELATRLQAARKQIEQYKATQQQRLQARKNKAK